ncbi:response regulator transcription factor [Paenibacillus senegalimassiliensis]|uniref:response regulator transcription factor n=1 Tax=Paenibacillus senegalimassiliensis TaxID=1737426 RepID=UPI00073E2F21|nr:response regulator transcription factor [Paenibacillus senegalimassiliensis]
MYKVFLVDDEPFILEGLYDIIDWAKLGMEIVGQAENGLAALEALKDLPVDLLITDISMPRLSGLDLIRQARAIHPDLKVIVLSGYDDFAYLKEGMSLGIENYLLKPINLEEFNATLHTVTQKLDESKALVDEHSIRILRDNVMTRWMRQQIGSAEFHERAELLGITLDKPKVLVALLRIEDSPKAAYEAIAELFAGQPRIVVFQDMDGDLAVVFNIDDTVEGARDAEEGLAQMKQTLESYRPVRIAAGSIEAADSQASVSYAHAKKALEYFLIFKDRDLIRFEDLGLTGEALGPSLTMDWDKYPKLLLARNKEAMDEAIDEDFHQLATMKGVTPEHLQLVVMEWLIRFKMQLKEIRHTEEPDAFNESLARIRTADSLEVLIELMQEIAGQTITALTRDLKSPVIQQVLNTIHTSYNEDLSLKTLGALYHIHPVYLGQLFHKEVGELFTEYINHYRIEKAKEQLRTTHLKVHEIARNVGYWEPGYFYKQFRKYVGVSPTEFKGLV